MIYPEPFFDPETRIIHGAEVSYVPDPKGVGHAFYTQMKRNRRKTAQIHIETGQKEKFESMLTRCIRTAIEMRSRGIQPGDVITICAPNTMDNYIPYIATQFVGAVMASLDPSISPVDTTHLLQQVEPRMIFVDQKSEELIEEALKGTDLKPEIIIIGDSNKYSTFSEFVCEKQEENSFEPHAVDDLKKTAVILFSSGTTGLSKGICINHYGLFYQAYVFVYSGCDFDRILAFATTYWVSTVMFISIICIYGKCRCIMSKFNAKELWSAIDRAGVTFIFMAPSQAVAVMKSGRPDNVDTTSLRDVIVGGGPFSAENNLALRDLLPGSNVHLAYGQSESAGLITMFRMADRKDVLSTFAKPTSSGRPIIGFKYKIVNPETGDVLGANEKGELRFYFAGMMNGYHKLNSSEAFDEDGWIKSGDIAYFDEDLCFYIVDRIKEMLKYQGFHVPPAKIEGVLNTHPKVASSVVIGIPHDEDGDHAMGLVILQGDARVSEEELVNFVNDKLDERNHIRAGVRFLTSFPFTPSGKVRKQLLRKMILNGEL